MFNIFKKKPSPEEFVERLRPRYSDVVSLVKAIDGPFIDLYEAGIFISSVATSKILTFKKVHPPEFADEFNATWINYLISSYSVNGENPSREVVAARLQEKFNVYRELFFNTIDPSRKSKAHDSGVQLMWELFSNCTGKQKPEGEGGFVYLVAASSELVAIGTHVLKDVYE